MNPEIYDFNILEFDIEKQAKLKHNNVRISFDDKTIEIFCRNGGVVIRKISGSVNEQITVEPNSSNQITIY